MPDASAQKKSRLPKLFCQLIANMALLHFDSKGIFQDIVRLQRHRCIQTRAFRFYILKLGGRLKNSSERYFPSNINGFSKLPVLGPPSRVSGTLPHVPHIYDHLGSPIAMPSTVSEGAPRRASIRSISGPRPRAAPSPTPASPRAPASAPLQAEVA